MTGVAALARPEIRALEAYVPAVYEPGLVRLNANEAPWQSTSDQTRRGLQRYPEARPTALAEALSRHYGCALDSLFVTRGSSEAIDLLIRCFCRPGHDEIVICPPTFGMYQVYAGIQDARVIECPLRADAGFALPTDAIVSAWSDRTRLVFVCSPNNPTGHSLAIEHIEALAERLAGRGIVVIDAAYVEFADAAALMALRRYEHVVVLRTLSKAYGLAGARCGALIADPAIVQLAGKVMPPYAVPTPTTEAALAALANDQFERMPARIAALIEERKRVAAALEALPGVVKVWPSDANFLLVEFRAPADALQRAHAAGLLLRDFSRQEATRNCLRITIGSRDDNERLLRALEPGS